jgi:hypothetical protein
MPAARAGGLALVAALLLPAPAQAAYEFVHKWDVANGVPSGVAAGDGDRIYHSAYSGASEPNYVDVFADMDHAEETPGTLLDTIGLNPTCDDGEFYRPIDVETDSSGTVYVLDMGNINTGACPRVQAFEADGDHLWTLGTFGTEQGGHFRYPTGVAVSATSIYVNDAGNDRIQQFDKTTRSFERMWGKNVGGDGTDGVHVCTTAASCHQADEGSADGQFISPQGIDTDSGGNVYVGEFVLGTVQKFTSAGGFLTKLSDFSNIGDIAVDPDDRLAVIGGRTGSDNWVWLYGTSLQQVDSFGPAGTDDGELDRPVGLDWDSDGYLYITDFDTLQINVFSEDGPPDDGGGDGDGDGDGGGDTGGGDTPPIDGTPPPTIVDPPLRPAPPSIPPPNPPRVQRPTRTTRDVNDLRRAVETGMVLVCMTPPGTICVSTTGVAYRCTPSCARIAQTVKIGASRFTTQPGSESKVRFKLNKKGRKLLKNRKRMRIVVTLRTTREGQAPVVTRQNLTLRYRKRR